MDPVRLASLMCSRVCHDLISPVGAINNGLEILEEETDPAMMEQVVDLLKHSAGQSSKRLQYYRLAFGAGGGLGSSIELNEAESAARDFFDGGKVQIEWSGPNVALPRDVIKVLMGLVLAGGEAVVRDGVMKVSVQLQGDEVSFEVLSTGERIIVQDVVIAGFKGELEEEDLDPRSVAAWMVFAEAEALGGQLSVEMKPGIELRSNFSCKLA